jgi:glutaredoxin-related protein
MNTRPLLPAERLHPAIRDGVARRHRDIVDAVEAAIAAQPVVVVGMRGNPFVRKARKRLDQAGIAHHDLDFGSYFGDWRRRNALKMWSGWPTFPMVFVKGQLIGGADELGRLVDGGELQRLLA